MAEFDKTLGIASAGLQAQTIRLRVIAENIANAGSLAQTPDGKPYQRKVVTFENELDRQLGVETLQLERIARDRSGFGRRFEPNHPAADAEGYVQTPNVQSLVEMMDLREAQRSYEANLRVVDSARTMVSRAIELLR